METKPEPTRTSFENTRTKKMKLSKKSFLTSMLHFKKEFDRPPKSMFLLLLIV
jgi:hypothetical protein